MSKLFKKLNLKDQKEILVLNAPSSFDAYLNELVDVQVHRHIDEEGKVDFALTFVTKKNEVEKFVQIVTEKAPGDAILWFVYPKMSSKKFTAAINRDSGWEPLTALGFKPVRQVAIDQDWSALRFRRENFVGA